MNKEHIKLESSILGFRMLDEGKSKRFHIDFLGYETEWEHRSHADNPEALYTQVRQGGGVLHLNGPADIGL